MKKIAKMSFLAVIFCFFAFFGVSCAKNDIKTASKNLTSYSIVASFDDEKKMVFATEKILYINQTGVALESLYFHLYPRAFREGAVVKPYTSLTFASCFPNGASYGDMNITSVLVKNKNSDFEFAGEDEDILKVNFDEALAAKKSIQIDIDYELVIPNSTHRLGWFDESVNLGNWYPVVAEFINGEFELSPYYATGDPFCSAVANYEVDFIYPSNYEIVSTGQKNTTQNNEKKRTKITAKAVRDFAISMSANSKTIESKNLSPKITLLTDDDTSVAGIIELATDAINFFSKQFGKYPYKTLSIAKTPFIFGGMEYPNLVLLSNSIDDEVEMKKVIVHEIAHQWWYAVVGNNEIKEAWLDESLSEYSTALFFEHNPKYGISYEDFVGEATSSYELYVDVIQTLKGAVNTKMNLAVNEYQNDYEYSYMVYVKGVIMFDSLKNMVGEKSVVAGLKKYYESNKFKIATAEDFFNAFHSACHKDLKNFFDGFLNGTAIISTI